MTQQEATLLLIKGTISELPDEKQKLVAACAQTIRDLISNNPAGEGLIALALVGSEIDLQSR
ncbi:hypothetical protein H2Y56_22040 [Pectobacterium aroidearum]|uniref:Uncharacterized protein n=1 Tax=Pectobacterium aroidearum TaxID=1201031 RepID=A0ABR5ZJK7_9GAMM|nr:hypothetical protein [Pectobacterium aroidearum]MBA5234765.1 hypothetical protein [Pectobacterium aroidearum]MBA5739944.1 hypothetical protein [Pectobacterium aroidearum]